MRSLEVLLPAVGSAGDVHPVLALGIALQSRGHRATILTDPIFQELIEGQGVGFLPVGRARCRGYASRMDSDAALARACELIEGLSRQPGTPGMMTDT